MANIYKWVFKTACAILILSNTFDIVMAVFDVSQSVIADAAGLIQGSTDITPDMLAELETTLEGMDLGPLLGLWLQSSVIGLTMQIMGIIIFVLVYGRMIEIYLMTSLAPLPVATLSNRELGGTGQNYLKSLFAVGFQGMLILVCVAIYAVLIQGIATAIFIPFMTRELRMDGQALYYGMNALSHNVIMADRKKLKSANGMYLGSTGSGKSFAAKRELLNVFLTIPQDRIIIVDPMGEYAPLVRRLGGQVIEIAPDSPHHLNPMDVELNMAAGESPLSMKADFLLSLCELVVGGKEGLGYMLRLLLRLNPVDLIPT